MSQFTSTSTDELFATINQVAQAILAQVNLLIQQPPTVSSASRPTSVSTCVSSAVTHPQCVLYIPTKSIINCKNIVICIRGDLYNDLQHGYSHPPRGNFDQNRGYFNVFKSGGQLNA